MARSTANYALRSVILSLEAFVEWVPIVEDSNIDEMQVVAKQECIERRGLNIDMDMSIDGVDGGEALDRCLLGVADRRLLRAGCQRRGHNCQTELCSFHRRSSLYPGFHFHISAPTCRWS